MIRLVTLAIIFSVSFLSPAISQVSKYQLHIQFTDKDKSFNPAPLQLQTSFDDLTGCLTYINTIPSLLRNKGYVSASVDSIDQHETFTQVKVFLGKQYRWVRLTPGDIDKKALAESGYMEKNFKEKLIDFQQLQIVKQRILDYYEKSGYPFAEVFLDSIKLTEDRMDAILNLKKNNTYKIDSIRVLGNAKVSKHFLQHYLSITNGSLYNKDKLLLVNKRILELPYVRTLQPADLTMLGTGAVLNLYLAARKSSQANFLVGFLPSSSNDGKLQVTADVNLDLKNVLGAGENIVVNWQQLQPKSPRLNLGFNKPYIFNSDFGVDFAFNLFKKDSSFLQVNGTLGLQYIVSSSQSGKVFMQWQNSYLLEGAVDTNLVKATKKLPPDIDVSSVSFGLDYDWNKTDYKLNPRTGNEFRITTIVGIKTTRQNNEITSIKDPSFNYASLYDSIKAKAYQLRFKVSAAHYFPVGKQGAFKAAVSAGAYFSPDIFRNELFQIGGYRLMRGFNEESIYATHYGVVTAEYRYRLALNSFLFAFIDAGQVKNKYQDVNVSNTLLGTGLGMAFETKLGLLNISYAVGKRDDVPFNIRESSKIHFGYVNYF